MGAPTTGFGDHSAAVRRMSGTEHLDRLVLTNGVADADVSPETSARGRRVRPPNRIESGWGLDGALVESIMAQGNETEIRKDIFWTMEQMVFETVARCGVGRNQRSGKS